MIQFMASSSLIVGDQRSIQINHLLLSFKTGLYILKDDCVFLFIYRAD